MHSRVQSLNIYLSLHKKGQKQDGHHAYSQFHDSDFLENMMFGIEKRMHQRRRFEQ